VVRAASSPCGASLWVVLACAQAVHAQVAHAQSTSEPTPVVDPRATPVPIEVPEDPAATVQDAPALPDDDTLVRMVDEDLAAARPIVRRAARSSPRGQTRALALRLLGGSDPSSATSRICARALRVDADPLVRRAGAECLGRLGAEYSEAQTHVLVGALTDSNLDVVTMSGWALANVGAPYAYAQVASRAHHEDPRVARLFLGYAERMRARVGLDFTVEQDDGPGTDDKGNKLVPAGVALTTELDTLNTAASVGWIGVYGASVGWLHGTLLPSAQGGPDGATIAPLLGLGGSALAATGLGTYGFLRANSMLKAHTIVHFGTAGTLVGFGSGLLAGQAPANAVAAANLSLLGTLGGTALGIGLVELDAVPTAGSLALGLFSGLVTSVSVAGLSRAYLPSNGYTFGMAAMTGGFAATAATLATRDVDLGLFPLAGGTVGLVLGAGLGGGAAFVLEREYTETSGWLVLSGAIAGAASGVLGGLLLPRALDPFLSPDVRPDVEITPPSWVALDDSHGGVTNAMVVSGSF
jgi:hypothetical protein